MGSSRWRRPFVVVACVLVACLATPVVYVTVQAFFATVTSPLFEAIAPFRSRSGLAIVAAAVGVAGAVATAAIIGVPLGWSTRYRPALLGAVPGIVTALLLLTNVPYFSASSGLGWVLVGQFAVLVTALAGMAMMGAHLAHRADA